MKSNKSQNIQFKNFLRTYVKKGFYEILLHVQSNPKIQYNEILKYAINKKILSAASLTICLNSFTENNIIIRKVTEKAPLRTSYIITQKGSKIIKLLQNLEKILDG